jgi:hypothetical protein
MGLVSYQTRFAYLELSLALKFRHQKLKMGKAMEIICRLEGMSKNIVDDARFEKVLSFLESNLRIEKCGNLDELFMDFETVREGHFLEAFQVITNFVIYFQ